MAVMLIPNVDKIMGNPSEGSSVKPQPEDTQTSVTSDKSLDESKVERPLAKVCSAEQEVRADELEEILGVRIPDCARASIDSDDGSIHAAVTFPNGDFYSADIDRDGHVTRSYSNTRLRFNYSLYYFNSPSGSVNPDHLQKAREFLLGKQEEKPAASQSVQTETETSRTCEEVMTVRRGDTLWGIAQACGDDAKDLVAKNPQLTDQIDDPKGRKRDADGNWIYPGDMVFRGGYRDGNMTADSSGETNVLIDVSWPMSTFSSTLTERLKERLKELDETSYESIFSNFFEKKEKIINKNIYKNQLLKKISEPLENDSSKEIIPGSLLNSSEIFLYPEKE